MVVASRKACTYSAIHSFICAEEMSRIQKDLAASHLHRDESDMSNGMASSAVRRILMKGTKPRVCVVGAGFAGLRCADILLQQGIEVTIYEARDRVGGRVRDPLFMPFEWPKCVS
jgi:NADPH-dependent 2,4-dienoyl-CoA reductase/sulfur reductase-like enzyme